ncbi:MAG: pyruvate:ferredoxin (flavodoxin) oxidoreductase [Phycisphaerales bacterium]|nr:pyruvate:ferredoxin (flavodoxin) oxidoreductase [Phycisphaerales bacterium]
MIETAMEATILIERPTDPTLSDKSAPPQDPSMNTSYITVDGNEACASIAYRCSEVIAIYPITPASPMGELADAWAARDAPNVLGVTPRVIEMQSEGGAAGAVHGSLQAGALCTTFTASQGLLLMIPNMFKIAGELTPTVFHIAARTLATHALSIFGDHSDVMSARSTGWAMLCSSSVQEAQDLSLIAHSATLRSRVPFLHFFDGFRTSHEVNRIVSIDDETVRAMLDEQLIREHRERSLDPDRPVLRGTAQNPDVFFQAREACNLFYDRAPGIIRETMKEFADRTGRRYDLFEYVGDPAATRVIVIMGSGVGAVEEAVAALNAKGAKAGLVKVRLYRPFDAAAFAAALPATVQRLAVLDRTKEPGAVGEPLFLDVVAAIQEHWSGPQRLTIIGGRYGLSSKEFTPAMAAAVFDELARDHPRRRFTVGIVDDVTHLSLKWDPDFITEQSDTVRAVFYGLGSDGTVGANKNSVKIIGENAGLAAQGYFVYDSRKAGSVTVSHLRFGPRPIESTYLIQRASFIACHQFHFLERIDVLELAERGATVLLNSPFDETQVWDHLPREVQETIIEKRLRLWVVDATAVAREVGLGNRINTVMQPCFFALSGVLPREQAVAHIKDLIRKTYTKMGQSIIDRNIAAVDRSLEMLREVKTPARADSSHHRLPPIPSAAPDFVQRVTSMMIAGKGDLLPVSALPVDGTFLTGTTRYEKRSIAQEIPIWDADLCTQCGLCPLVCPHAAIRSKAFPESALEKAPATFESREWKSKEHPGYRFTIQVAPEDCTGCGICVDVCPVRSKEVAKHKAINMTPKDEHLDQERDNFEFFLRVAELDRRVIKLDTLKGSQLAEPLFEFSGACAGCGETPYLKLLTQLFGDRLLIANATGCSSIYGGNLPTTPWTCNADGRGPAWCNSLFEDNAEFGLGIRLGVEQKHLLACELLRRFTDRFGEDFVSSLIFSTATDEVTIAHQRDRVAVLKQRLREDGSPEAIRLLALADQFVPRSVWIVGGDGWAYDIGFGGVDHILASGVNVNLLVLDTEVYSNTGGQASKSTPRGAVAKFASGGKHSCKKDLGLLAMSYGNVYVAQIAMGAHPQQTLNALREAESYPGVSLIIAYSHCIAHGIDMSTAMTHQKDAVNTGYWPLYRYDPRHAHDDLHPLRLDSRKPTAPFKTFAEKEARFAMLARSNPAEAARLFEQAQADIDARWRFYEQMVGVTRHLREPETGEGVPS